MTRKQLGLSLAALSARAGVSRWRLIEFELGNVDLRPEELGRIRESMRRTSKAKIAEVGKLVETLEFSA